MKKTLLSLVGLALVATTMSFRAPEGTRHTVAPACSIVVSATSISVNPNDAPSADHVVVTLRNPSGAVVDTRYTAPGQAVSFTKPANPTGYWVRSKYFTAANEFVVGDDLMM